MKNFCIIILILLFSACNTRSKNEKQTSEEKYTFYYPKKFHFEDGSEIVSIDIDTIKNFGKILEFTDKIACGKKYPALKIQKNDSIFNIMFWKDCSIYASIGDYKNRNVISIQGDSIIINEKTFTSFENIDKVLPEHILNPSKNMIYSTNPERSIIMYYQDSTYDSKKFKEQILKIAKEFNKLNLKSKDSLSLNIKLNDYPAIR